MRVRRFDNAAAFLDRAGDFLLAREAEHNLLLGICAELRRRPDYYGGGAPYLATVDAGGAVVAAAVRTPPRNLLLSVCDRPAALEAVAADLHRQGTVLPAVSAPVPVGRLFATHWSRLTGRPTVDTLALRIYQLHRVIPPNPVPGTLRRATAADRELLVEWIGAFQAEAMGRADPAEIARAVDARLASEHGAFYLWEDGRPVSLTGYGGPTPRGMRVGPVYTPPALRGRGYASACVAAVSQALLDSGRRFCFLFTELANPTSNHIYGAIGYAPVCDVEEVSFAPDPAA